MSIAQQIKRRFEALKTKATVLKEEAGDQDEAYLATRSTLHELRDQFKDYKIDLKKLTLKLIRNKKDLQTCKRASTRS